MNSGIVKHYKTLFGEMVCYDRIKQKLNLKPKKMTVSRKCVTFVYLF